MLRGLQGCSATNQYSLNGLGLAVREILGEVGFRELM
jgi:hypothetical protein